MLLCTKHLGTKNNFKTPHFDIYILVFSVDTLFHLIYDVYNKINKKVGFIMNKKLNYLALAIFSVSVFSLGRFQIHDISLYFNSVYRESFSHFSAIWFFIIPFVAALCRWASIYIKKLIKPVFWLLITLLIVNIILAYTFMLNLGHGYFYFAPFVGKTIMNTLIVYTTIRAFNVDNKNAKENNTPAYKNSRSMCQLTFAIASIIMCYSSFFNWNSGGNYVVVLISVFILVLGIYEEKLLRK